MATDATMMTLQDFAGSGVQKNEDETGSMAFHTESGIVDVTMTKAQANQLADRLKAVAK